MAAIWGLNHVFAKLAMPGVSLVMQAAIRFIGALVLLVLWARWRKTPLFAADGTLAAGLLSGCFFSVEFFLIFHGLAYTTASHMTVFIYLSPCVAAIGLQRFVPGEQLSMRQWLGMLTAFSGVVVAFADGFLQSDRATITGDAMAIVAGIIWGATTVVIRATPLSRASAEKTYGYQLAVAAVLLPWASMMIGEPGIVRLSPAIVANLLWQTVFVSFASMLAWFWLLTKFLAGRLSAFTFISPLIGVLAGALVLGDPLTAPFVAGALLVAVGVTLVNWRA